MSATAMRRNVLLVHDVIASAKDEMQDFSPSGYKRKRTPAQGGHGTRQQTRASEE